MKFIGVDLTSAFARRPRGIDIAVLEQSLSVRFYQAVWPERHLVTGRVAASLCDMLLKPIGCAVDEPMVLALDGPQALARDGEPRRACERILGTPGRTPCELPDAGEGMPFQGYIRSSIDLFAALMHANSRYQLAGFDGIAQSDANLFEVFPGAEWTVLAGGRLPAKTTRHGREARYELFCRMGLSFLDDRVPSADQNDAIIGAYLAWCAYHKPDAVELVGDAPMIASSELTEGFILHATVLARAEIPAPVDTQLPTAGESSQIEAGALSREDEDDWNSDDSMLLFLTDYGAVHATEPENKWLCPGVGYILETQPPDKKVSFRLDYAAKYPGGLAWCAAPTVKEVLRQLGYAPPLHLSRKAGATLRVKAIY